MGSRAGQHGVGRRPSDWKSRPREPARWAVYHPPRAPSTQSS